MQAITLFCRDIHTCCCARAQLVPIVLAKITLHQLHVDSVMPRSTIIDPVMFTINHTGSSRSRSRTNTDRILAIRSCWRFDGGRLDSRRSRSIDTRSQLMAQSNNHSNYKSYIKKVVTPQDDDSFHSASIIG